MSGILNWLFNGLIATNVVVSDALRGECHIEGDTVVRWVENTPVVAGLNTIVNASRERKVIATCKVGADNGHQRLPFALSLAGRFTAIELALGSVTLSARNTHGNGGKIRSTALPNWKQFVITWAFL